jgi:hypothetical protein
MFLACGGNFQMTIVFRRLAVNQFELHTDDRSTEVKEAKPMMQMALLSAQHTQNQFEKQ